MPDSKPFALVTCGPAHEPIDGVRRITNVSSGELGILLCEALTDFDVLCLRGEMATYPAPNVRTMAFGTNESLLNILHTLAEKPTVIFHAAALCDFAVARVEGAEAGQKIRSDAEELRIVLRPAVKVLPKLPEIFPEAVIVGWKYELDGDREDALARGRKQIASAGTAACVVNGAAYGEGFGFVEGDKVSHFPSKSTLCAHLAKWAREKISSR